MGYCLRTDIERIIAQSLTSATANTVAGLNSTYSLLNVGNTLDKNLITDETVDSYIQMADREIDAALSELYKTPLTEVVNFEGALYSDIDEYNPYIVLYDAAPLTPGDILLITDNIETERHEIDEVLAYNMFSTVNPIDYFFSVDSRVLRVSYPNPIRFISSRKAAANIYDKYFSAEVSPSNSAFGETLRNLAFGDINNILNGTIILHGQHRIGRRFYNPNLVDQYALPFGGTISKEQRQIK